MKTLLKLAVLVPCVALVLVAAIWGALQLPGTKRFAAKALSQRLSKPGQVIELEGLSGWIPFSLGVKLLRMEDAEGPWLEVKDAQLDWNPWMLLRGRLQLQALGAERLRLLRLPQTSQPASSPEKTEAWSPPKSLFPITVERLFLDHLFLGAPVVGEALSASLEGTVRSQAKEGTLEATLTVTGREKASGTRLSLDALFTPEAPHLSVRLQFFEPPAGWVQRRLGMADKGEMTAQVEAEGDLSRWEGAVTVQSAALGHARFSLVLDLPRTGHPLRLSARGTAEPSRSLLPEPWAPVLALPANLSLRVQRREDGALELSSFQLTSSALDLDVAGRVRLDPLKVEEASYQVAFSDLQVLSSLTGLPVSGKGLLEGTVRGNAKELAGDTVLSLANVSLPKLSGKTVRLQGRWSIGLGARQVYPSFVLDLDGEADRLVLTHGNPVALERLQVFARGRLAPEGKLVLKEARVQIPDMGLVQLSGTADLGKQSLEAGFDLELPALGRFSFLAPQDLAGRLKASGTVEGPWNALHLKALLEASHVAFGTAHWKHIRADLDATDLPRSPQGRLTLHAEHAHGPLILQARFAAKDGMVDLSRLNARFRDAHVQGNLEGNPAAMAFSGHLALSVPRLEQLGEVVGQDMRGSLQARLDLTRGKDGSRARGSLSGTSIGFGDFLLQTLRCDLDVTRLARNPEGTIRLAAAGLKGPSLTVNEARVAVEAQGRRLAFSSRWKGRATAPFQVEAQGVVERKPKELDVLLNRLSGRLGEMPFSLDRPPTLKRLGNRMEVSEFSLRLGDGAVRAEGVWEPGASRAAVRLQDLDLKLVRLLGGPAINGRLNGRARLLTKPAGPRVQVSLNAEDLRPPSWNADSTPAASAQVDLSLTPQNLRVRGEVSGFAKGPTRLEISLPVRFHLDPFAFRIRRDTPLRGFADLTCDLERLTPLLELDRQHISGLLRSRLYLSGLWPRPEVNGTMDLDGGRYENEDLGLLVQDLRLSARASGGHIRILELTAQDGLGGRLKGSGTARLGPSQSYPFSIQATLEDFAPTHGDDVFGKVSGQMSVSGSMQDMTIRGRLTVQPLQIMLPQRLPPEMTEIQVEEVGGKTPPSARPESPPSPTSPSRIRLDLAVDFPRRTTVRGWGLDSQWKGAVRLSGTTSKPMITGRFQTIRGTLDFLNKRFQVKQGTVDLHGSFPPDPVLDVTAEAALKELTAVVTITGPASKPAIQLSSTPERPQDEVLAQILFGRSASKLTPFQALRLAKIIKTLATGGTNAPGMLDRVRSSLGVDAIELKGTGEGLENARLGVGKYLSDTVRVEVEQGLGEGSGRVGVEVEVTPNISLETELGGDTGAGVGVQWRIDY
ncbi:autotransporter secretion inner membrane protein TamB [Desulfacinum hydrothermale DSM 13146]|uniref:Autotransporter secretion inner membrane protein TamB n=1 Tax=Desulfacinum hydrothermale DSM 13146 TaxID=1121390 RepID=A0A1W1XKY1_9BACT|nr:translocation/assembly module TamB domain-containing protein [Desulfacinum hydrothermale]SMC24454.1 autotransporter secretion inner membrane protein TamB [Desulfacinum hydrothermale DSM 13146]